MTYNICHCLNFSGAKNPGWVLDDKNITLPKTAEFVKSIDADMVGLNEVFNGETGFLAKQADKIAELSEYKDFCFGKAIELSFGDYGNAFLSKYKIKESETYSVPAPEGDERRKDENKYYEDRVVMREVIDVDGVAVSVYVTHFGLNLQEKKRMIATLTNLLDKEKNPCVLMGDFNSEPDDEILKPLFDRLQSTAKVCGNSQKTFATYGEKLQIDYIFVSKEFEVKNFVRIDCDLADHYPCMAEVVLRF